MASRKILNWQLSALALIITTIVILIASRSLPFTQIDVGGHNLRVLKISGGPPTVVFENGGSRVGRVTLVLAIIFVAYRWSRDFRLHELPDPIQDGALYIEAYYVQLSSQAQLYRDMPSWYLAPFIPRFTLILLGRALLLPEKWPMLLGNVVLCTLLFVGAAWLIRRTAQKLELRAQALHSDV